MIDYIIAFLAFLSLYKGTKFFLTWKKAPDENIDMSRAKPFFYKRGKTGVLLVHGFSSTPYDLISLSKFLARKRITVKVPLLPGHGTTPEDLATKNYHDWLKHIDSELKELKKQVNKIFIGGVSMGGNISFLIGKKNNVDGIISLGTPINFRKEKIMKFLYSFLKTIKKYHHKRYRTCDLSVIKGKIHYHRVPIKKISDVLILNKKTKKILPDIKMPVIVLQSSTDYQLDNNNAEYIYKKISSKIKKLVYIPDSHHVFILDKNKQLAYNEIYSFIKNNE